MKIRIYGKTLKIWTADDEKWGKVTTQKEISYREYDSETGEVVGAGSEDFSMKRLGMDTEDKWVWTWDGQKLNKGDKRWFECRGVVRFRKGEKAEVKKFLQNKYGAAELQLR